MLAINTVNCDVDIDRLFYSDTTDQKSVQKGGTPAQNTDISDEQDREIFSTYRNLRQNELDWELSKVNGTVIANPNKFMISHFYRFHNSQNVLSEKTQNMILSPFLVRLMIAILAQAGSASANSQREIEIVLSNFQSTDETHEIYKKALGSMLVGSYSCSYSEWK